MSTATMRTLPLGQIPLRERAALHAARVIGGGLRLALTACRPGSAAEAGLELAGFDMERLRRA